MDDQKRPAAKKKQEGNGKMGVKQMERGKMRRVKAQELIAYLAYAVEDVRAVSPTSSHLLEMSIAAINEDMDLSHWSLQDLARKPS